MAERIVGEELVDWICFTIGGIDQETYGQYHKAGSFSKAMQGMRLLLEERRRTRARKPIVHWRYLLFRWNDSDACIAEALKLREEIGVDEFRFLLTASPMEGRSLLRAPGTPGFKAIKPWLAYQDDYCPDPYIEAGLWGPERNVRLGAYRWTGKQARIRVAPSEGEINVRLARAGDPMAPVPEVTLRLPWGEFAATVGVGSWGENRFAIPLDFSATTVDLELEVDKIFSPFRHSNAADNRELGVMICMEGVSPAQNPHRVSDVPLMKATNLSR